MQWYADVGPVPQHIAGLLHVGPTTLTATQLAEHLERRLTPMRSLHRYPMTPRVGAGGPVWLADDGPVRDHISVEHLVGSADQLILARATTLITRRFGAGRAPWSAHVLTGSDDAPIAVLLVMHHVLADGRTGNQLIMALTNPDEPAVQHAASSGRAPDAPSTMPSWSALARDAWAVRLRHLRSAPSAARALRPALRELGIGRGKVAPRTALNRPTGPQRRYAAVTLAEMPLRAAARTAAGSLNDAVLAVVADVLAEHAGRLRDDLDPVVVSVPVAPRRRSTERRDEGSDTNTVGLMPTPVATRGPLRERIGAVAEWRHARLDREGAGASLPLVIAAFRVVHALHLVRWYSDHQRLVTTFATTIRGPAQPVTLAGCPVSRITPLVVNQGNTTIAFASITYAGQLTISIVADPASGPDPDAVARRLRERLLQLLPPDGDQTGQGAAT